MLHDRADPHLNAFVDDRLQQPAALLEGDVMQRLVVELDQVDGHERAAPLLLERVGQLLRQPLLGNRLGPGSRQAAISDERLRELAAPLTKSGYGDYLLDLLAYEA